MDSEELFTCGGRVNIDEWQLNEKSHTFVKSEIEDVVFSPEKDRWFLSNLRLFDRVMPGATAALNLKHLTISAEMTLRFVNRCARSKIVPGQRSTGRRDFRTARNNVCQFLIYLRSYFRCVERDALQTRNLVCLMDKDFDELFAVLENYLNELRNVDDSLFHYAGSSIPIENLKPQFHMYHLHLEIRWLLVTLVHAKELLENYSAQDDFGSSERGYSLEAAVAAVVDDLVYIASKLFEKIYLESRDQNLSTKTLHSCTCIRQLWLVLQIFVDDLAEKRKSKTFWEFINRSLDERIGGRNGNRVAGSWLKTTRNRPSEIKNSEMFCIWLIYHLGVLYGYNFDGVYIGATSSRIQPNYDQVEKILKLYVNKGGKAGERDEIDAELQGLIQLLTPLICEWWRPRVQVVSLLWDCFHRRLDQPFLLRATGPWLFSVEKKGPANILTDVKERLEENSDLRKNISSYGMFLRLLGRFLGESRSANDAKNWNQLRGRIYSKFTNDKVANFTEIGLYNFISLFLTIALTTNTSEVCTTMLDFLASAYAEENNERRRILAWKGNLAVFLLFAERRIDFTNVPKRFAEEVDVISCRKDETSRAMLASYVDVLSEILTSSDTMELSEHSFVGGWIDRYLLECPKHKMQTFIGVLVRVIDKCASLKSSNNSAATGAEKMLDAMWEHVAGRVRMLVLDAQTRGDHYQSLAELAVRFTLGALKEPAMAQRHRHKFVSLFTHFSSSVMIKDVRIIRSYLTMILKEESAVHELKNQLKNFDSLVVQAWIKCCVLENDPDNEETRNLTRHVVNSDEIIEVLRSKGRMSAVEDSNVQILDFMSALMERRQSLQTEQARSSLDAKCREYFGQMEKWAMTPITEETKATTHTEWIYRCVGTLILHCAPMLYVKTQPRNALSVLINKFMLPSAQTSHVIDTGKKIFWMVISGVGKLDVIRDLALQRTVTELFENYLPQLITNVTNNGTCQISESLYKCFKDGNVDHHRLIFEKLTTHFILVDKGDTHRICYLVMLLAKNLLSKTSSEAHIIDIVISVCLPSVIACHMKVRDHHSHRLQTIDLISVLSSNQRYKENLKMRDKFAQTMTSVVRKYLPTAPVVCFEFVAAISNIIPETRQLLIEEIENTVSELERTKYPTNIAALRFSLNKLQENVRSAR